MYKHRHGLEAFIGKWDRLRCEWAKKYALVGDEGPKWGGQSTDVKPPPGNLAPEDIMKAYAEKVKDMLADRVIHVLSPA